MSLGAAAAAVALIIGGAVSAQAAPGDIPESSNVVITRLSTPPAGAGAAANGVEQGQPGGPTIPTGATGVAGVTFQAYAVPLPGSPASGSLAWQQTVAAMTIEDAQVAVGSNASFYTFAPTAASTGVTTWTNAPRGLYLIRETSSTTGVTPARDFLLAVPLTDPVAKDRWLDTIYVYPKRANVTFTKAILDEGNVAVGEVVKYTIQAQIPRDVTPMTKFEIVDTFDTRLTPQNAGADLIEVSVQNAGATTLVPADYDVIQVGQKVTVAFTSAGRTKLAGAWVNNPNALVQVVIPALVNTTALLPANTTNTLAGTATNSATLTISNSAPVVSNPVELRIGDIKITKVNAQDTAQGLAGAKFSVYRTMDDAANRTNAIVINGNSVFTTGANGVMTISGLFFSDFVNGALAVDDPASDADLYREYWINEVEAPAGFQLLAAPISAPVTGAGSDATAFNVLNSPTTNGFVLPLTGGMGTALLTFGGIAILATVLLVARRRRNTEAIVE